MSDDKPFYKEIEDVIFVPKGIDYVDKSNPYAGVGWIIIFISWIVFFITFFVVNSWVANRVVTEASSSEILFMMALGVVCTFGTYNTLATSKKIDQEIIKIVVSCIFTFITFALISIGADMLIPN